MLYFPGLMEYGIIGDSAVLFGGITEKNNCTNDLCLARISRGGEAILETLVTYGIPPRPRYQHSMTHLQSCKIKTSLINSGFICNCWR